MNMKIVHTLPDDIWRQFVDQHPSGNIFHTPEMFRVFEGTKRHCPAMWAVVTGNGQPLVLMLPVQVSLNNNMFRCLTARSIVYGGILWKPDEEGRKGLALLCKSYTESNFHDTLFTELRNLSDIEDARSILQQSRFIYEDHLNYLIDLDCPPETVFQKIGPRTRKNIKRGIHRASVVIREAQDLDQVAESYTLLEQTYHEARVPLADRSLFEFAFCDLYPKRMIKFTLAYVDEVPVATSVDLLYKDTIFGWYGGVNRTYSNYVPNELLMWHILEWGSRNGYRIYDFGGAGKPDEAYGVRDFKAKFGGELVCYGRYTWVPNPLLFRASVVGYDIYRRFL